jgi:hypothetical protein
MKILSVSFSIAQWSRVYFNIKMKIMTEKPLTPIDTIVLQFSPVKILSHLDKCKY